MAEPLMLHLSVDGDAGTLDVYGPLVLWQALLASLGYAPMPSAAPTTTEDEDDPEAVQADELYGGE